MANDRRALRVFESLESLSEAAAALFVESASLAVAGRGRFLVALSGGSTPAGLYRLLGRAPYREQVAWAHVHVFWGDERCVPSDDPENSYGQARALLLDRLPLPEANIHRIRTELEPGAAAEDYARLLKSFAAAPLDWPRLDLVLLGMGEDGHTASLFPGSPPDAGAATLAVTARYQDRPSRRVTLTPAVINAARRILFLVSGQGKSGTLADVLYGGYRPDKLPAQRIRPADGELIWLVDQGAASRL